MSDNLRAFIERTSEVAECCFKPEGQMFAHIYAEGNDGKYTLFVCPMGPEDEIAFRVGVPAQLRASGKYRRWCFFTEAWAAEYTPGQAQPLPAKRTDRMEIVTFAAEDAKGRALQASRQIYREPGKPARLLPLVFPSLKTRFVMAEHHQNRPSESPPKSSESP